MGVRGGSANTKGTKPGREKKGMVWVEERRKGVVRKNASLSKQERRATFTL